MSCEGSVNKKILRERCETLVVFSYVGIHLFSVLLFFLNYYLEDICRIGELLYLKMLFSCPFVTQLKCVMYELILYLKFN